MDGQEIPVKAGDTLPALIAKINESGAPVKASFDPSSQGLVITGTNPHLIRMEDGEGSTVLQELGIIQFNSDPGAPNWHPSSRVQGGSVFDMVIRLRDGMLRGDTEYIGSLGLSGIDSALGNVVSRQADIGSRHQRVSATGSRLNEEIPNVTAMIARESGVDMATAATDLAMLNLAHRATLMAAAKIPPATLLDFLR